MNFDGVVLKFIKCEWLGVPKWFRLGISNQQRTACTTHNQAIDVVGVSLFFFFVVVFSVINKCMQIII